MKITSLLTCTFLILFACEKKEPSANHGEVAGKWQLTQVLLDPGDGSGIFTDIKSSKTITFKTDLTIEVDGGFCGVDTSTDGITGGTYDPVEKTIEPDDCVYSEDLPIRITYAVEEGFLYIYFPCIEPCAQKYRRLE